MQIVTTTKKPEDEASETPMEQEPERPTRAVPISTVKPITRPNPKVALIESSSRPLLTDTILKNLIPQPTRQRKIPEELGIQSALPAPKQAPSQSSERKRKHIELEPDIKVLRLECNRSLPEGVPFVNNMVIEKPEYGMFFIDVFGN
ncbi:hypothetical protein Tco_0073383 [Tanacetum coccineum]